MALTENGFERETYEEIVADMVQSAKDSYGEDIDTSDLSVLGKFIRIVAKKQAEACENDEAIYYARFPNTATGTSLDRLCPYVGITRNPPTPAIHTIKIVGTLNAVVPMGFLVSTYDGDIQFYTLQECKLSTIENESGSGTVQVECVVAGTNGNVSVGGITSTVETSADVDSISHVSIDVYGIDEETDIDLRKRWEGALYSGEGNLNSIRGAILKVTNVIDAKVLENTTEITDSETGIPPHNIGCFVYASNADESEIAKAIFSTKSVGIGTYGTESYDVTDNGGYPHTIKFSYSTNINLKIKINVKVNALFGANGKSEIQNNISEYINNLGMGVDVIHSSLYACIYKVTGTVNTTNMTISIDDGTYSVQDVDTKIYEVARISNDDIEVTTVSV